MVCAYGLGRTGAGLGAKGNRRGWEMCEPICSAALLGSFFSLFFLKKRSAKRDVFCLLFLGVPFSGRQGMGRCAGGGAEKGKPESEGGLTRCEEVKVKWGLGWGGHLCHPPEHPRVSETEV